MRSHVNWRRERDTGWCASEDVEPQGGLRGGVLAKTLSPKVDCEIPHRLGKRMKHSL